jgi:uncharacterized protein (TIGR02466 family)
MSVPANIYPCWPTPIYVRRHSGTDAINSHLSELVLERVKCIQPNSLSNVGSRRTESDLLRTNHPAIKALSTWIFEAVTTLHDAMTLGVSTPGLSEIEAEAWGNVYLKGDYQMPHIHHDSIWSGVYYVEATKSELSSSQYCSGILELFDPRAGAWNHEQSRDTNYRIIPEAGMLVVFPSWLAHSVTPHNSDHPRISIAFNAGIPRNSDSN